MSRLETHPRREEFIELAEKGTFYGVAVVDMGKKDLLMMIGYLGKEKAREREFAREVRETLDASGGAIFGGAII